jgi:hypothetical protein
VAILKFNTPPAARVPQRAQQTSHGSDRSLQHAAFGEPLQGGGNVNTLGENVELATRWSTAPYRGPDETAKSPPQPNPWGYRDSSRQGKCTANNDTCNGNATKKSDLKWCAGHAKAEAKKAESGRPGAA